MIGVTVFLARDSVITSSASIVSGTRTNKFGFYSLPALSQGSYYLVVKGIGYRPFVKSVTISAADAAIRVNVPLVAISVRTQEIVLQVERDPSATRSISTVELKSEFISKMPTLGSETDIFRVLQLMPGIKAGSEISSGLYVRGGSPDQNLTLLDGVIVYNPSHLGGFLSVFNNDAIRDTRVIKGGFPAEYGGRLSSVIDLTMKEGSKERIGGSANLSLLASRLLLEGPINENCSFMIAGRRTYFDAILNLATANLPVSERPPQYYFYDLNAKINYKISDNDHIFASGYFGGDVLQQPPGSLTSFGIDWGNAAGNLRWMHIVSPNLFTNFTAAYSDYRFGIELGVGSGVSEVNFTTFSQIRDLALRGDVQYFPTEAHSVKAGVEAIFHRFTTAASSENTSLQSLLSRLGTDAIIDALEASLYVQDDWKITPALTANIGLRLPYFQRGNRFLPEPRVSASYNLSEALQIQDAEISFKGAFAVANQFLHLVVRNDIALPSDTWFPSTERVKPANAIQYVLGAEAKILGGEYLFSVEGYYKTMRNLYEFRDNASFFYVVPAESQLVEGVGDAYGVEFFLNKRLGAFTGWVGYTLAWTTRTFADLNDGKPFFPRFDRRHDISVVLNYKFSDAWELGATWTFATGQAFTMPTAQYLIPDDPQRLYAISGERPRKLFTERNGFRLPDFHKLDVNFTHYFSWFGLPFNASFSVYNLYNRRNAFQWTVAYVQNSLPPTANQPFFRQVFVPFVQQLSLFPIIPTVSIGFKF